MLGTRKRLVRPGFNTEVVVIAERNGRYTVRLDGGGHVFGVAPEELRPIVEVTPQSPARVVTRGKAGGRDVKGGCHR